MVSIPRCFAAVLMAAAIALPQVSSAHNPSPESVAKAAGREVTEQLVTAVFADRDEATNFEFVTSSFDASLGDQQFVIRGQNATTTVVPPYDEKPATGIAPSTPYLMAPQPLSPQPMMTPSFPMTDPWANQGGGPTQFGAVGPQPFRYGWQLKFDVGNVFNSDVETPAGAPLGDLSIFEFNGELRYTAPLPNHWIWSFAPQASYRGLSGPLSPDLPSNLYRAGIDVGLTTPTVGPYTVELGFTPSVGSDFDRSPGSNALMWDGRGALFLRTAPQWMWVIGAQFWDRVNDKVVPWAGVVFTPNDRWEVRAVFPNPQVSAFLGTPWGVPAWLYVAGEYHVEAYEVSVGAGHDQMEIQDWRVMLGLRTEQQGVTSFIEGGWVFNRNVRFRTTPEFDINDGFLIRGGMKF